MKTKIIIFIIFLAGLAAGGWLLFKKPPASHDTHQGHRDTYYCPMHPHYTSDRPGICPICQMKLVKKEPAAPAGPTASAPAAPSEKKILYWTDHMIPGYKASGPGKSPMGMDLVPVYEEASTTKETHAVESASYSPVSIDLQKQQLMGIKTTDVTKKSLIKTIHAYGYVAHDLELYEAQLEYIEAWRAYYAFVVRRPTRDEFRQDWWRYDVAMPAQNRWHSEDKRKAQERLAKAEYELIHMGLTDVQIAHLREIKYGQPWIQPDLLFFDKDSPFWVYAQVPENDLGYLAPTQKVMVTISVYGEAMEGVIKSVAPFVDPMTRTSRVRIELPSYKGELSVNMYANVDIPVELDNALVVPRESIMDTGLSKIVFVQTRAGVFEPRKITAGFEGNGMVAVKSGLTEGEKIAVSGNFLLDSESRLQGSLTGGQ